MLNSSNFPNLSSAKLIGYDLETYDPYLIEDGPGWGRGVGHILGVSLAVDKQHSWYFPLGKTSDLNTIQYLKDILETDTAKCGANLQYDMGWLSEVNISPGGYNFDIQIAEALLDDVMLNSNGSKRSVSLDNLAMDYLGRKKEKFEIETYLQGKYPRSKDFRENLWKAPEHLIAEYAKADAWLPIEILKIQWKQLEQENLTKLFKLESELLPLLVKMRIRGVPIDLDAAYEAREVLALSESLSKQQLYTQVGSSFNLNSSKDLEEVFKQYNLAYNKTAKGNPSFTASFLEACEHPIPKQIVEIRRLNKARVTFIENALIDKTINGKIHPSFHPLRSDTLGTVSGRFSSSQPNAQQFPKRNKQLAPIIRGIVCPEAGYSHIASMDLSQIEYRFFAHFSDDQQLIEAYQDPNTDFHAAVGKIIGGDIPRIAMKIINFGLLYGMGRAKLTAELAKLFPGEESRAIQVYDTYREKFPAAAMLLKQYAKQAETAPNEVQTILGRKARFRLWTHGKGESKHLYNIAYSKWGSDIQVADSYKAINRVLQGSAADLMKKGMVDAFKAGVFKKIGVPHITVHDELVFSYHPDLQDQFEELRSYVENAIPLKVPIKLGLAIGPNWGQTEEI